MELDSSLPCLQVPTICPFFGPISCRYLEQTELHLPVSYTLPNCYSISAPVYISSAFFTVTDNLLLVCMIKWLSTEDFFFSGNLTGAELQSKSDCQLLNTRGSQIPRFQQIQISTACRSGSSAVFNKSKDCNLTLPVSDLSTHI